MPDNGNRSEKELFPLSRRDHLKGIAGTGAALTGLGTSGAALANAAHGEETDVHEVTVSEGTNIAVTASPDGETLIMEHARILFRLPGDGGEAEQLTDVELEPVHPDYSPDGNRIAFQGYDDGIYDLYTMSPDGNDVQKLTDEPYWNDREPEWSPDGSTIAFASDRGIGYDIWTLDVDSGEVSQWTDTDTDNYLPTWSPEGSEVAYITNEGAAIEAIDGDGNTRTLFSAGEGETFRAPSWGPNGDLAYVRLSGDGAGQADLMISGEQVTDGEDVFVLPPHWLSNDELLYTADGEIRTLERGSGVTSGIPFTTTFELPVLNYERKSYEFDQRGAQDVEGIQTPALSPNGQRVAFVALNDLWTMQIGQRPTRVTDDQYYETAPAWSPDGRYLAYSSDRAGTEDIYVHDTQTGSDHRVTSLDEDAAYKAAWSPDGSEIAFRNQDGAPFIVGVDVDGDTVEPGEVRQILDPLFEPGPPTWSADGNTLAMTVLTEFSDRFGKGPNQILTVDVESGETETYPAGGEFDSIATRNKDGPVWSPDGRYMAFVVESTLRVMPVAEDGEPDGSAVAITDEATDGPSWSGDSEWLLYLNNGQLKKVRRDGSETQEIPLRLNYQRQYPTGRTVVYAGQMWDGTGPGLKEDVTIEIVNNRIQRVEADTEPPNGQYVDASNLTVIPGLWDCHQHRTYSEEKFGARQGLVNLAYGVTTTVDRAAFVYHAVHDREAFAANEHIGPRYFMTGELIDGSRTVFPTNRTTTSLEQIELEMSRAIALDYDFLKTYENLNVRRMAAITDAAHDELGVPAGSHYLMPGANIGQNGTTHLGDGGRWGYPRIGSATNRTYDDVVQFYTVEKGWSIATFFDNSFILASELEDDPRLQLFPPWRREGLLEAIADNEEFPTDADCVTETCRSVERARRILDNGGLILAGTDAPLVYNGVALHANLRPLAAYGLSTHQALLTATRFAAEHQGVEDDLGTIESGKLADMVFVDGNPLEQIKDAMNVRMTMKDGELYTIEDLVELFEVAETDDADDIYQGPGDDDDGDNVDVDGDGAIDEDDEDKDDDDDSDGNNRDDDGDGHIDEDDDQR
jgi:Tol biopolymer transport system component